MHRHNRHTHFARFGSNGIYLCENCSDTLSLREKNMAFAKENGNRWNERKQKRCGCGQSKKQQKNPIEWKIVHVKYVFLVFFSRAFDSVLRMLCMFCCAYNKYVRHEINTITTLNIHSHIDLPVDQKLFFMYIIETNDEEQKIKLNEFSLRWNLFLLDTWKHFILVVFAVHTESRYFVEIMEKSNKINDK